MAVRWLSDAPAQACFKVGQHSRANPWLPVNWLIGGQVWWKAQAYAAAWNYWDPDNEYVIERDYVQTDCGIVGQERPMPEAVPGAPSRPPGYSDTPPSSGGGGSDSTGIVLAIGLAAVVVAAIAFSK
jgi:hypothetical protein